MRINIDSKMARVILSALDHVVLEDVNKANSICATC